MLTDKKISRQATDRRMYHAPSPNGTICPYLKVDVNGDAVRVDLAVDDHDKKVKRCVCTESVPFCSYQLGDGNEDPLHPGTIQDYFCHRYDVSSADQTAAPVDTHERKFGIKANVLGWYK